MILCANVISTNSEQPFIIVDTNNLSQELQKKIEQSQQQKKHFVSVTYEEVDELFNDSNKNNFPITVEGYLVVVSD